MILLDSSCWLEYFAATGRAETYAPVLRDPSRVLVPTICLTEVFRRLYQLADEATAFEGATLMRLGQVIELSADLAWQAGKLGRELRLPLADSIIYATASANDAELWTQDAHFKDLERVRYFAD